MAADDSETLAPLLGEPFPVELMNTVWADRTGVFDELRDPASALRWWRAVEHRVPASRSGGSPQEHVDVLGPELVDSLRRLRDALRRLAAEVTGDDRSAAESATRDRSSAIAVLNQLSASAPSWSELAWAPGGEPQCVRRTRRGPGQAALAAMADDAATFFAGDLRRELRACHAPGCVLYFVRDHPRRQWCSAACGNRARVARHYERHHRASGRSTVDEA